MEYAGQKLDRGQLFEMRGLVNDDKLVRLEYVYVVDKKTSILQCGVCGAEFIDLTTQNEQGNRSHRNRFMTPDEEDRQFDQQENMLNEVAPLNLENTSASRGLKAEART